MYKKYYNIDKLSPYYVETELTKCMSGFSFEALTS